MIPYKLQSEVSTVSVKRSGDTLDILDDGGRPWTSALRKRREKAAALGALRLMWGLAATSRCPEGPPQEAVRRRAGCPARASGRPCRRCGCP